MNQILGRLGLAMAALSAATVSSAGSAEVMRRPQTAGYSKPTTRAWVRFKGRPSPAGTKLARQAAGAACTLRGRKPNGDYP